MEFIYLHGFASSPGSKKAVAFKKAFNKEGASLIVPDLQDGNFEGLTISSQIEVVEKTLDQIDAGQVGIIGSSMGGYLAALLAQRRNEVAGLYLMAPGFDFLARWQRTLLEKYPHPSKIPPLIEVYHYGYDKNAFLDTNIFQDAEKWEQVNLDRKLPVRIVHGTLDESVDIGVSEEFVRARPWSQLIKLESDHGLISHIKWLVADCLDFFNKIRQTNK